ncbi:MAG: PAS domain-containing protein, partial [Melioribacteraceae bacterium]
MNKLTAKIWARKEIAESTCEVEFQCDASGFDFKPGQYLEVIIPELLYSDTKGNNRNFSIVSIPNKEGIVSIVFRVSGSGFKRTLLELPIGSEVILRGPFGVFKLPEHTEKSIVFIAGGVGISPFMSMLKFINEQNIGLQVTILYANSNPDRAVYVEELEALTQQNANLELRLKYGYIDDAFIRHNLTKLSDKVWYVAGPPAFIRSMLYLLHELGIKNNDVFIEEMFGYDSGIGGFSYSVPIKQSNELSKIDASSVLSGDVLVSAILEVLSQTALVTITDTEGIIFYANEYLAQVSKYSSEEIIGQNNNILKSDYHSAAFYTDVWETIRKGKVWRGEIKNKAKDGSMYWVDSAISPIFGEKGQIINYIAIQFLITDKKNAEEELLAEKLILEQTIANMKEKSMELENIKIATFNILEDLDEEKKAVEKKVQERTLDLQNEKEKLLQVTKNMKEGAILFDSNTTPVFVNETCYQLFSIHQKDIELTTILNTVADYFMPNLVADLFQKCFDGNTFSVPEIEGRGKIYELNFQCLRDTEKADKIVGYFLSMFD